MKCQRNNPGGYGSGTRFSIKMTSYQYRKSHCGDKTVIRLLALGLQGYGCENPGRTAPSKFFGVPHPCVDIFHGPQVIMWIFKGPKWISECLSIEIHYKFSIFFGTLGLQVKFRKGPIAFSGTWVSPMSQRALSNVAQFSLEPNPVTPCCVNVTQRYAIQREWE